ncbi:MAG TPA: hypothetical protein VH137_01720 [Gemmatimonadales bacterium]|nr:hypothetical protein [Gemmatimonadales bacterium]
MSRVKPPAGAGDEAQRVASFLRSLATQAEGDPALAGKLQAALEESGLVPAAKTGKTPRAAKRPAAAVVPQGSTASEPRADAPLDPFGVYRDRGEEALRAALADQDIAALRGLIRAHRLDPARISARWTTPDRLIALILQQVQARANIGKAFAHI